MSVVSVKYERSLGPWNALEQGEWTDQTASGDVAVSCARCSQIFGIDPSTHRIEADGFVVPAVKCESKACGEFGYIRLMNYADEVVR